MKDSPMLSLLYAAIFINMFCQITISDMAKQATGIGTIFIVGLLLFSVIAAIVFIKDYFKRS